MTEKTEIQAVDAEIVPVGSESRSVEDMLALLEKRSAVLGRILNVAIAATTPEQWVDQQGKPFPTAAAAEVMARRCLVSVKAIRWEKTESHDDAGSYYLYSYTGDFSLPGGHDTIQAVGTCSSRDQFLGTETSKGRALSAVDEGNIKKAAYSNMMVNGVTRLLGVRNLTWERLKELGIDQGKVAKVEYRGGAQGGNARAGEDPEIKFGSGKGKKLSQLTDDELRSQAEMAERNVQKEDPKWHKANVAFQQKVTAEIARRASSGAAASATPSGSPATGSNPTASAASSDASVYDRLKDLALAMKVDLIALHDSIKRATGKTKARDLVEADFAKVKADLEAGEKELQGAFK